MDVFELFILFLFIGLPLLEGLLRRGKGKGDDGDESAPQRSRRTERSRVPDRTDAGDEASWEAEPREPARAGSASDMVPDDLWEVLTGERRDTGDRRATEWEDGAGSSESAGSGEAWSGETVAVEDGVGEMAGSDWLDAELDRDGYGQYESLETELPTIVSLEQPLQDPEVRHQDFHEKMDSLIEATSIGSRPAPDRAGPLRRALGTGAGLRKAVLLSEVLGPPVSLRDEDHP